MSVVRWTSAQSLVPTDSVTHELVTRRRTWQPKPQRTFNPRVVCRSQISLPLSSSNRILSVSTLRSKCWPVWEVYWWLGQGQFDADHSGDVLAATSIRHSATDIFGFLVTDSGTIFRLTCVSQTLHLWRTYCYDLRLQRLRPVVRIVFLHSVSAHCYNTSASQPNDTMEGHPLKGHKSQLWRNQQASLEVMANAQTEQQ